MEFSRNISNEELLVNESIKNALDGGNLVLIDKVQTANPEYTNLYFIGRIKGLASSNTEVSSLAAKLLGWNNSEIYLRSVQNASTEIADSLELGSIIPGTMRVVDSLEKSFESQNLRIDRNGKTLLHNGQPIYRNTFICTEDELQQSPHMTLVVTEKVDADGVVEKVGGNKLKPIKEALPEEVDYMSIKSVWYKYKKLG